MRMLTTTNTSVTNERTNQRTNQPTNPPNEPTTTDVYYLLKLGDDRFLFRTATILDVLDDVSEIEDLLSQPIGDAVVSPCLGLDPLSYQRPYEFWNHHRGGGRRHCRRGGAGGCRRGASGTSRRWIVIVIIVVVGEGRDGVVDTKDLVHP
jgi:hypothetical protein